MFKSIFVILVVSFLSINAQTLTINEEQVFEVKKKEKKKEFINKEELFKVDVSNEIKRVLKIKNSSKLSKKLTKKYYKDNDYQAFFISKDGIKPIAHNLLNIIKNDEVLKPKIDIFFKLTKIENQIELIKQENSPSIEQLVKLDFMLISTYHKYMKFLSKGIIDWKAFKKILKSFDEKNEIIANWEKYSAKKNIRTLLYKAIKEDNINVAINEVNYNFPKANQLANLIKEYEQIAENGGYIKVPEVKKSLKKGNYYPEIITLRKRLIQSNDLEDDTCNEEKDNLFKNENILQNNEKKEVRVIKDCLELFDENVFNAVKAFQKRHGLSKDGVVGKNTIKRLNIPIEEKIKKMRINLERMRWMPRQLGEKYLLVNIPEYKLKMYKKGEKKLEMAVVVGERRHPTPIFSHKISTIVLNPYWRIPQRIVKREIIPKLVKNPSYLEKNDIIAFENWSHKSMKYDISNVDWSMYIDNDLIGNTKSAPMRFIQIPGKKNPLGRMKFLFPNRYSVYLHDTPAKSLFKNNRRAYSHGCIRLEKPHELLKTIAFEDQSFKYEEAEEILSDIEKTDFYLKRKFPVHIVYLTSWIDEEGKIQFRDDIYKYDKIQGKLLYN